MVGPSKGEFLPGTVLGKISQNSTREKGAKNSQIRGDLYAAFPATIRPTKGGMTSYAHEAWSTGPGHRRADARITKLAASRIVGGARRHERGVPRAADGAVHGADAASAADAVRVGGPVALPGRKSATPGG